MFGHGRARSEKARCFGDGTLYENGWYMYGNGIFQKFVTYSCGTQARRPFANCTRPFHLRRSVARSCHSGFWEVRSVVLDAILYLDLPQGRLLGGSLPRASWLHVLPISIFLRLLHLEWHFWAVRWLSSMLWRLLHRPLAVSQNLS